MPNNISGKHPKHIFGETCLHEIPKELKSKIIHLSYVIKHLFQWLPQFQASVSSVKLNVHKEISVRILRQSTSLI